MEPEILSELLNGLNGILDQDADDEWIVPEARVWLTTVQILVAARPKTPAPRAGSLAACRCDRCDGVPPVLSRAELYGGTHATLCDRCLTDWPQVVSESDAGRRKLDLDAHRLNLDALALAGQPPSFKEWTDWRFDRDANEAAARDLARQWIGDGKEAARG